MNCGFVVFWKAKSAGKKEKFSKAKKRLDLLTQNFKMRRFAGSFAFEIDGDATVIARMPSSDRAEQQLRMIRQQVKRRGRNGRASQRKSVEQPLNRVRNRVRVHVTRQSHVAALLNLFADTVRAHRHAHFGSDCTRNHRREVLTK